MGKDKDMSRRRSLKMATSTGAVMCVRPTLSKVMAAERIWTGKQQAAGSIPADMAAVHTRRTLGHRNTAFTVSAMGYGCMGLDHNRSRYPSREKEIALMHGTVGRRVTLFDTAGSYGYHINEKLVDEALKGYTNRIFVSSKFGHKFANGVQIKTEEGNTLANIRRVCENSLCNLRVETLGMFYQRRIDPNTPIEAVAGICSKLIKKSKVLHRGMCEVNVDTIHRAHKVCPATAIQNEYHLIRRMVETNGVLELCEDLGIGSIPYNPLNHGFLGGMINKYTKFGITNGDRQALPRFQPEAIHTSYRAVEVPNAFSCTGGVTPTQIVLAWLMNKKPFIMPISSTTKLSHLEENLRACDIRFTAEKIEELETAVAAIPVVGGRYNALQGSKVPK